MKKIFQFILSRPEFDGILLGALLAFLPFLAGEFLPFRELDNGELPDTGEWYFWFLCAIPAGAFLASLAGKKFKFSLVANGTAKNLVCWWKTIVSGVAGGMLTAAGALLAGNMFWNQTAAAADFRAGGWLFVAAMLITAVLIQLVRNNSSGRKDPGK